jgi:hypothetical protein
MATTLADLEQRVQALEAEVSSLRQALVNGSSRTMPGAADSPEATAARLNAVFQEMGIVGEAPGIEKLRAMLAAHGIHPGDEDIRREIAGMRDQEVEDLE